MILTVNNQKDLFSCLDDIGLKKSIIDYKSVLVKVNLARIYKKDHPRTDINLLLNLIQYIYSNNGTCAIAESANGYLKQNLETSGLLEIINKYNVTIIDLDLEEVEQIIVNEEQHYIPKCLKNYGVRIAVPATSKRSEMIFSNNIKLFVGAVPRRMYQLGDKVVDWRPRIHIDLNKSVANIFSAIQRYAPFDFFINGGLAMDENRGEFVFEDILIGDDGIELDLYVIKKYFSYLEIPEYLKRLENVAFKEEFI
jgi:uncharacterized protein (DUF362 family)